VPHGRLAHQESACHLLGAQATEQAQRQGHLSLAREGRVTAREDQPQPVVADRVREHLVRPERDPIVE